jgi:hypothetical protein
MTKRQNLIVPAVVVGIVLLALAGLYFVDSADSLPSFMPGHEAGSTHHHLKHGIAAAILGIGAFLFAWFQTDPGNASSSSPR